VSCVSFCVSQRASCPSRGFSRFSSAVRRPDGSAAVFVFFPTIAGME
jgi:hypothetical protein